MHGLKVGSPSDKPDEPFGPRISVIQRFSNRRALCPSKCPVHHPPRGDDLMIILAGNNGLRVFFKHIVHRGPNVFQVPFRPGKAIDFFIIRQQLQMDLQTDIGDLAYYVLYSSDLLRRNRIEIIGIRISLIILAGYGKCVFPPE